MQPISTASFLTHLSLWFYRLFSWLFIFSIRQFMIFLVLNFHRKHGLKTWFREFLYILILWVNLNWLVDVILPGFNNVYVKLFFYIKSISTITDDKCIEFHLFSESLSVREWSLIDVFALFKSDLFKVYKIIAINKHKIVFFLLKIREPFQVAIARGLISLFYFISDLSKINSPHLLNWFLLYC